MGWRSQPSTSRIYMRATKLTLRSTLIVLSYLARECGLFMPKFPQPKERPKSLWNALAPSLYLQVNKKKSIEIPESPGLGRVRRGQERSSKEADGYRALESKSLLWAREWSQQTKVEGILEGGHFSPSTPKLRVEEGRTREQSVYNYFYVLFLESSSTWKQGWG